jgi:hypothetical protein
MLSTATGNSVKSDKNQSNGLPVFIGKRTFAPYYFIII